MINLQLKASEAIILQDAVDARLRHLGVGNKVLMDLRDFLIAEIAREAAQPVEREGKTAGDFQRGSGV